MNSQVARNIRVLHVYRTYFPDTQGGIEEVIRQICLNTASLGVENRVFSLSNTPEPRVQVREEAALYRFNKTFEVASCGVSLLSLSGFRALVEWADIIHYQFPWPFADVLHLTGRVKKPSLVSYQSDVVRQKFLLKFYRPVMRQFLRSVDVIAPSTENYYFSSEELGRYKDKIKVVPIGLDDKSYPDTTTTDIDSVQQLFGTDFFLFVGVLRYYKGLHILLEALAGAPVQCVIAGSGPEERALKDQADRLGLKNVHFTGFVSDIEKVALLKLCRAVVFPSHLRSEAFGVTLVEGAMYGKPLISTEIGTGTSFINLDGKTGLVVPPKDPAALRHAMLKLDQDHQLAEEYGRAARLRYEAEFTGKLMGARYAALYSEMLKGTGHRS